MTATALASIGDYGVMNTKLPKKLSEVWIDRDLSWLDFNYRVLAEAMDERTPLLEKAKFLAIFTSNLDEFFMKRVAVLREGNGNLPHSLLPELRDKLLPMLDQSLSALLEDLHQRGRLAETLVVAMGEFGRTPRINGSQGRDHYPQSFTVVLAGGGIRGGQAIGSTNADGVGIAQEHQARVFTHGFTTKKAGHGIGLHSSALECRPIP